MLYDDLLKNIVKKRYIGIFIFLHLEFQPVVPFDQRGEQIAVRAAENHHRKLNAQNFAGIFNTIESKNKQASKHV